MISYSAPEFRFRAKVLENRILTDIRLIMWRLTPMPDLSYIQCGHSGRDNQNIILTGVYSQCTFGDKVEDKPKGYKIRKNIKRYKRLFHLRQYKDDEEVIDAEDILLRRIDSSQIRLSFLELVWILFVNISIISFVSSKTQFKSINNLWLKMIVSILISTLIAIVFNLLFVKLYKYLLLQELKQQSKMDLKYEKIYFVVIKAYNIISIALAMVLCIYVMIWGFNWTDIQTYQWFCITFCSSALFSFLWIIISDSEMFRNQRKGESESEQTINSASILSSDI